MNVAQIQTALKQLGYDPGPIDGKAGAQTTAAVKKFQTASGLKPDGIVGPVTETALKGAVILYAGPPQPAQEGTLVPSSWLSPVKMIGIVFHWSAGAHIASGLDKTHYHIIIEGSGNLVRGKDIAKNAAPLPADYAAHTKGHNTSIIGVSLACMAGAQESPFKAGSAPMTPTQWGRLPIVLADLCHAYKIPVTRQTVLSHAEVQKTLGIKQNGKWDITWTPGMVKPGSAFDIGDGVRASVAAMI